MNYNALTKSDRNLCEYGGAFGVLITITCLIQHFALAIPNWLTNLMIFMYLCMMVAFLLLGLQKHFAPWLIMVGALFSLAIEFLWMMDFSFSPIVIILFLYHIGIIVFMFVENIPRKLKQNWVARKTEEESWNGKI